LCSFFHVILPQNTGCISCSKKAARMGDFFIWSFESKA
jgi:hypothetical protein